MRPRPAPVSADGQAPGAIGRFDDLLANSALLFTEATEVVIAHQVDEVAAVFDAVDAASARGQWAFGYVSYEAAPGLNPDLAVVPPFAGPPLAGPPLVWFSIGGPPQRVPVVRAPTAPGYRAAPWSPTWRTGEYDDQVRQIQAMIAAGLTYQANLTVALESHLDGDVSEFYAQLAHQQRGSYAAYLDIGSHFIASASPELFYERTGQQVRMRPMKGTAARGRTAAEDVVARRRLLDSAKERAENIMILDLLRNDLSRIAETGSVTVTSICQPERYETVWQLVSELSATVPPGTSTLELFRALFPSGSVTGAPKVATMRILAELETSPRGPYCGAIGFVGPRVGGDRVAPDERFNVAIRTAVIDKRSGSARYGAGGAITWNSTASAEHAEVLVKSKILNSPYEDFELFETMAHIGGLGPRNLDRHLARLASSADYFGFHFDRDRVVADLDAALAGAGDARVRMSLCRKGTTRVRIEPLPPVETRVVRLAIDLEPVDSTEPWLFHKTTRRGVYLERSARHPDVDDVILTNERGEVTETTIANIVVQKGQTWSTPPIESGCLPGVGRAGLIESGELVERRLSVAEVLAADGLAVVSSLRGWRPAELAVQRLGP